MKKIEMNMTPAMERNEYITPESKVIFIETDSIICTSGGDDDDDSSGDTENLRGRSIDW